MIYGNQCTTLHEALRLEGAEVTLADENTLGFDVLYPALGATCIPIWAPRLAPATTNHVPGSTLAGISYPTCTDWSSPKATPQ
jgi:hypothetical protein